MKIKVEITRTEVYKATVEVEADNAQEAQAKVENNFYNGEYKDNGDLFEVPEDVTVDFKTEGGDVMKFSPFKKMKVIAKVDWDGDEGDELPDPDFEVTFTADELKNANNCLNEDDDDPTVWNFYKDEFEEWFGEYLTSFTDFCHNGFTYTVQPIN